MNILIYTTHSTYTATNTGGAETSLRLIAEGLAKTGHSVVYLALDETLPFGYRTEEINGVTAILHSSFRNLKALSGSSERYIEEIEKDWLYSLFTEIIITHDIQLVHTFYELNVLKLFIDIRARLKNFVIVMRMAGLYWYEHARKDRSVLRDYSEVFDSLDSVNFISSGLQELTVTKERELGCNFRFKHSFVGDIGVRPLERWTWSGMGIENIFKIIVATRLSAYAKRQDLIIEAVNLLRGRIPLHVKFIGSGVTAEQLQRKISAYNLVDTIEMVPCLKQEELWNEMQHAHLLCHPCDYEGLSKIIIESMSMGLPVLCSNVLAPSSYIEDGVNGFLVDNMPGRWAEKLVELYHKRDDFSIVSKNGRAFVRRNFYADTNIDLYEQTFSDLVHNAGLTRTTEQTGADTWVGKEETGQFCRIFGIDPSAVALGPGLTHSMRFLKFMNRVAYKVIEQREQDLQKLKTSYAFRIGNGIAEPARRLVRLLKQLRPGQR